MANLLEMLQGQLDDNTIDQLSTQLGGTDRKATAKATEGIMSTLVTALAKNASDPDGAANLNRALDQDHDGGLLDNLSDLVGGNVHPEQARAANGSGILRHVLGSRQQGAIDMISRMSGLDQNKTGSLMTMLAPIVMGMLGKQKKQQGLGKDGISDLLNGTVKTQRSSGNPLMDMATRFLDQDGDGSALDDVAGMVGKNILGKLFGRK